MKFTAMVTCSASSDPIAGLWGLKGKKGGKRCLVLSPTLGYTSDLGYSSSTSHLCNAIMDTDSCSLSIVVQCIEDHFHVAVTI